MRTERYDKKDGLKIWLNNYDYERVVHKLRDAPRKQLPMEVGYKAGPRVGELVDISKDDVRTVETQNGKYHRLIVDEGKTDAAEREVPIPEELAREIKQIANIAKKRKGEPVLNYHEETIRRWVSLAGEAMAEETGNDEWLHLTPHDFRRSWATRTYYNLDGSRALEIVMSWGGWKDEETFREHYLGRPPSDLELELTEQLFN